MKLILALFAGSLAFAQAPPQTVVSVDCSASITYADGGRFTFSAKGTSYCTDIPSSILVSLATFAQYGPMIARQIPGTQSQTVTTAGQFKGNVQAALLWVLQQAAKQWIMVQGNVAAQQASVAATAAAQSAIATQEKQ